MTIPKNPRFRRMDDPFGPIAADDARNARIGRSGSFPDDAAQFMAALRLDHNIHIPSRHKAGAKRDGQRSHFPRGPKVFLGDDGIDEDRRSRLFQAGPFRVHEHRDRVFRPDSLCRFQRLHPHGPQALHGRFTFVDGFAQGHLPTNGRRVFGFQHQHPKPCGPEPMDGPGRKVSAAAHNDQIITLHRSFLRLDAL